MASELIKINGVEEVRAALTAFEQKVAKKILRKGLRDGAKVCLAEAKSDAPSDSGRTIKNLKVRGGSSKRGRISLTVGVGSKDFVGDTFYAGFVLYGHFVGSRKLGNARQYVKPDNWLKIAYDESKDSAVERVKASWLELIEAEGAK